MNLKVEDILHQYYELLDENYKPSELGCLTLEELDDLYFECCYYPKSINFQIKFNSNSEKDWLHLTECSKEFKKVLIKDKVILIDEAGGMMVDSNERDVNYIFEENVADKYEPIIKDIYSNKFEIISYEL